LQECVVQECVVQECVVQECVVQECVVQECEIVGLGFDVGCGWELGSFLGLKRSLDMLERVSRAKTQM
jgi:hypothetical protein